MTTATEESPKKSLYRAAAASWTGMALESYDFLLYGSAAALVFNKIFFPEFDPLVGTMLAFVSYALGFFIRPLGGIVFGHFGDKIGRKKLMIISILLMGIGTFCIGLLPTYAAIGIWAAVLLSLLRMLQGFALGGEWGGAMLIIAERVPGRRRGFWTGIPEGGIPFGNLLATAALAILTATLPEEAFLSWGWRIPFLASAVLVLAGLWMRLRITDAPLFIEAQEKPAEQPKAPLGEVLRHYKRNLLIAASARLTENISYYVITAFVIVYVVTNDADDRALVLFALIVGNVVQVVATPLFGALSDRIGRKPVILFGAIGMGLWIFAFFPLLDTQSPALVGVAVVVSLILHSALYGPQAAYFAEQFDTNVRYTGMSVAAQVTTVIGGAIAPLVATALLSHYMSSVPVSIYVAVAAVLTVIGTAFAKETNRRDLAVNQRRTLKGVPASARTEALG
ncbi:MFS transporter [Microbacterium murale]|uniref:MFS transporter n=1 Tax=Microbacterium murale TaxID=1081040 RepID=A0ABQ1RH44_9MICO|nr:MFS transporter [Microbacterium murale]GGD70199.1 MFS transporter [Microbacterium murale]